MPYLKNKSYILVFTFIREYVNITFLLENHFLLCLNIIKKKSFKIKFK